jgi:hypothetical protein
MVGKDLKTTIRCPKTGATITVDMGVVIRQRLVKLPDGTLKEEVELVEIRQLASIAATLIGMALIGEYETVLL